MLGANDLRALCRPPVGVPVSFNSVSTYTDGSPICGLLDFPIEYKLAGQGSGGVASELPELRLPYNAFNPMPSAGDTLTVTDDGTVTTYKVTAPSAEDDGGFLCYQLKAIS